MRVEHQAAGDRSTDARSNGYATRVRPATRHHKSVRELFLIGAGGFARETAEAVRAINASRPTWSLVGFLDDSPERQDEIVDGLPVLGPIESIRDHPEAALVICTGRPDNYVSRRMIAERLDLPPERYATIIHPTATKGVTCQVGVGSVLLAHVDLTADVVVGSHVAVMPQVVLTHDVRIDDYATLGAGSRVGGAARVAGGAYIGSGACLRENITVGARAMVGMGSIVTSDVPPERLWFGSPARDMGRAPIPVPSARTH
jgi:sugar O-acyltransferase (sialic acid O-acetyltransferase NeuD family)